MSFDIMKLFEDNSYVSPGTIGGKIKRLRELRGYTQKELGIMCGFSPSTADVRIAQYEKNKKIPREKALKDICAALEVDECSLYDADFLPYNRMYHGLFDMEDFHGLHPVKKADGYYLEFSGHTILDQDIHKQDFYDFLKEWHEQYQKYAPLSTDSKEEKEQKAAAYALWRYEYPQNVAKETTKRLQNSMKMHRLQAEMDALNAEMQSENELSRLDKMLDPEVKKALKKYSPISKESDLILFIKEMIEKGVPLEQFSPEVKPQFDPEHTHVLSIKSDDLINNPDNLRLFATLLCHIYTMQQYGINIDRKITSKNKELYLTYEIPGSQIDYVYNLQNAWDDIFYIKERLEFWTDSEIKELNDAFLKKITGDNDVIYAPEK